MNRKLIGLLAVCFIGFSVVRGFATEKMEKGFKIAVPKRTGLKKRNGWVWVNTSKNLILWKNLEL